MQISFYKSLEIDLRWGKQIDMLMRLKLFHFESNRLKVTI